MGATDATHAVLQALESLYPGDAAVAAAANVGVLVTAVFVAAAALARLLARGGAAVRHAIWLAALGCVATGATVTVALPRAGLSLVRLSPGAADAPDGPAAATGATHEAALPPVPAVDDATPTPADVEAVASPAEALPATSAVDARRPPGPVMPAAVSTQPPARQTDMLRAVGGGLTLVWAAGALLGLLRLVGAWRWTERVRKSARPLDARLHDFVLDRVQRALGVNELPPVLVSDVIDSPVSLGLLRPAVLLPAGVAGSLDEGQFRDVLVHECAHVLRRDHAVGLLQRLVAIALWPHPCVHLLNRALNRAREEVCDNYVLCAPDRPAAGGYARALLALSEWACGRDDIDDLHPGTRPPRASAPGLPVIGILGPGWRLEARVAGLLDARRPLMTRLTPRTRYLLSAGLVVAIAAACGTRFVSADPPEKNTGKPQAKQPAGAPAGAADADAGSARDEKLDTRPGGEANSATAPAAAAAADANLAAALERRVPELRFEGTGLADVIDFLRDVTGCNLVVDWAGLEASGVDRNTPVAYRVKDVRTSGVLKDLTTLVGNPEQPLGYAAAGRVVYISTARGAERFLALNDALAKKGPDVPSRAILERTLPEVSFDGVGFVDVIDFLRDVSGGNINVHWAELEAAGIERNTPVTIRVKDLKYGQALQLILLGIEGSGVADFTIEEGRILIRARPAPVPATLPKK